MSVRYTRWDGRHRVELDADELFAKLGEYLSHTDDVRQALDWLLRQGVELESMRILGLDDFLERIREEMRSRYQKYDLHSALSEMRRKLDEILDVERDTLAERRAAGTNTTEKEQFLDRLPAALADAIERLKGYQFEDQGAARDFENLVEELDNIRNLESFQRRYGELFHGREPLDYESALTLMEELERLKQLERELMAGNVRGLDRDELGRALGADASDELDKLQRMLMALEQSGYLMERGGHAALSPKGVRKIGQLALRDIYQGLLRDRGGAHRIPNAGAGLMKPEATRPYRYGDPLHLDLPGTLKRAVARRSGTPVVLEPGDFQVHDADDTTSTSTILLLDMSWSMSWEGRFAAAKKVALAMESLIRTRYPRDYFAIVGFYTRATELKLRDLPEATWNMGDPFTNLQDGLRLASQLIARHPSTNQHFIVITDGQPTAYFLRGRLYCEWPLSFGGISMRAAQETLKEVERVTRMGITINTFMLDDSPSLRAFVEKMTQINRGRALYTRPDRLGEYLLVDYISRTRKKI